VTTRTLHRMFKEETPSSFRGTLGGIARALGYATLDQFDRAWRRKKVLEPPKRPKPSVKVLKMPAAVYDALAERAAAMNVTPVQWIAGMLGYGVTTPLTPAPEAATRPALADSPPAESQPAGRR